MIARRILRRRPRLSCLIGETKLGRIVGLALPSSAQPAVSTTMKVVYVSTPTTNTKTVNSNSRRRRKSNRETYSYQE